jgi:hypothetical protein
MSVDLPRTSGFSGKILNAGEVRNTGMELLLSAAILQKTDGFNWDISINAAKNYSEVISLHESLTKLPLSSFFSSLEIEARPGEEFGSIYANTYLRDSFGDRYIDDNGFPLKGEVEKIGDINPDLTGGINNTFSYKNLSFSFLVDFQLGGDFISGSKFYQYSVGTAIETLAGREEWYSTHEADGMTPIPGVEPDGPVKEGININTGEPNTIPVLPALFYTNPSSQSIGEDFVLDATNVRVRELVLTYDLSSRLLMNTPIKKVSLSLVGRNLFFLYRANSYADPESGFNTGSIGTGMEHSPLLSARSVGLQFKINF